MRVPKFRSLQDFIRFKRSYRYFPSIERDDPHFRLWNTSRDESIASHPTNYEDIPVENGNGGAELQDSHNSPDTVREEPVFLL